MIVHMNYASGRWVEHAQPLNTLGAQRTGRFDLLVSYGPQDLPHEFMQKHAYLMAQPRGGGYWIWKPYLILEQLKKMQDGDILFYTDSGTVFVADPKPLLDLATVKQPVVAFYLAGCYEYAWSKRDTVMALNMENKLDSFQLLSGIIVFYNCQEARDFVAEWYHYCSIPHLVDDSPSVMPNYGGFKEHRHDQTIFSLLYKRRGFFPDYPDTTQYGDQLNAERRNYGYEKVIDHHRDPYRPAPTEWGDIHDAQRQKYGYGKVLSHPGWLPPPEQEGLR
jgi:hypothetical protein